MEYSTKNLIFKAIFLKEISIGKVIVSLLAIYRGTDSE